MSVHVYPLKDLRPHDTSGTECACDPDVEWIDPKSGLPYPEGPLVIHNAFDGRQHREMQKRIRKLRRSANDGNEFAV